MTDLPPEDILTDLIRDADHLMLHRTEMVWHTAHLESHMDDTAWQDRHTAMHDEQVRQARRILRWSWFLLVCVLITFATQIVILAPTILRWFG